LHLFVAMEAGDHTSALERLTRCSDAVRRWFLRNHLQLNADKSDVMTLGIATQLRSVAAVTIVDVAGSLPVKSGMKSFGVIIDSHWRFDKHAAAVARACNYHIHTSRHARHLLTDETAHTVACSIVRSRLDYFSPTSCLVVFPLTIVSFSLGLLSSATFLRSSDVVLETRVLVSRRLEDKNERLGLGLGLEHLVLVLVSVLKKNSCSFSRLLL